LVGLYEERIVNAVKRGGGRRRPPNNRLIGRTEVARILQCDRSTVCRYEKNNFLKPALVEPDGVRWFDRETVQALAKFALNRSKAGGGRGTRRRAPSRLERDGDGGYYPERRSGRSAPKLPAQIRRAPQSKPPGDGSATQRGAAKTEIRPEWWDDDLTPLNPDDDDSEPSKK